MLRFLLPFLCILGLINQTASAPLPNSQDDGVKVVPSPVYILSASLAESTPLVLKRTEDMGHSAELTIPTIQMVELPLLVKRKKHHHHHPPTTTSSQDSQPTNLSLPKKPKHHKESIAARIRHGLKKFGKALGKGFKKIERVLGKVIPAAAKAIKI